MIGIIVVTHSNFAEGINNSVEMIAGKQDNFTAINFENGEDIEDLKNRIGCNLCNRLERSNTI